MVHFGGMQQVKRMLRILDRIGLNTIKKITQGLRKKEEQPSLNTIQINRRIQNIIKTFAMRKLLFILLIAFGMWFDSIEVFSQTERNIELLDFASNRSVGVNVREDLASQNIVLTNREHNVFETIKICDVQEIDTMYIVLNRFLIISYRFNGGTGEHLRHTKIFTVKNAALIESLSLLTRHQSFSSDGILQRGYSVSFTINKFKNDYYISLIEEERKSEKSIFSKLFKLSLNMDFMVFIHL